MQKYAHYTVIISLDKYVKNFSWANAVVFHLPYICLTYRQKLNLSLSTLLWDKDGH